MAAQVYINSNPEGRHLYQKLIMITGLLTVSELIKIGGTGLILPHIFQVHGQG